MESDVVLILSSYIASIIYIILGFYLAKWAIRHKSEIPNVVEVWVSVIALILGGILLIIVKLLGID